MKNQIIMQINYAERPGGNFGGRSIDEVCAFAAGLGFNGIEFRGNVPKHLAGLSFREYAEQIAAGKKNHGLRTVMFGMDVVGAGSADKDTRDKAVAFAAERARIAREVCETEVCNASADWISAKEAGTPWYRYDLCGSVAIDEDTYNRTVDTFSRISAELERIGLRFALETHMGYVHDLPASARKFVDDVNSPALGINLDYGNTVYFPNIPSVAEAIDICGDKLFYTHLKNSVGIPETPNLRFPTALGDGQINHREYFEKLISVGYDGLIGVEAPRQGDRLWYAKCDMAYVKDLLADLSEK